MNNSYRDDINDIKVTFNECVKQLESLLLSLELDEAETVQKTDQEKRDSIILYTIDRWEGRKITHDKEGGDPLTKWGVTYDTYKRYCRYKHMTTRLQPEDLEGATEETILDIYKTLYWNSVPAPYDITTSISALPEWVRHLAYDLRVQHSTGMNILQRGISRYWRNISFKEWPKDLRLSIDDGIIGEKTISSLELIFNPKGAISYMCQERWNYYEFLMFRDRRKSKYRDGWNNRCYSFCDKDYKNPWEV